jgi:hypothetical protein
MQSLLKQGYERKEPQKHDRKNEPRPPTINRQESQKQQGKGTESANCSEWHR